MSRLLGVVGLALIATSIAAAAPGGGDGSLDPAFAGGTVQTQVGFDGSSVQGAHLDSDGRLVVFGQSDYALGQTGFTILRYTKSGTLDESFGNHGVVQTPFGTFNDEAFDGAVQPDGKIIAAGYMTGPTKQSFALARYLPNGSLDPDFGTGGKVVTSVGDAGSQEGAFAMALQPDGAIVAAGEAFFQDDSADHAVVVRYLPSGGLDPTFGSGGVSVLPASTFGASAVTLQSDGKILVGTSTGSIVRLTSTGQIDTNFGTNGFASLPTGGGFFAIALDASGRILIPGTALDANFNFTLASVERLLPNGAVDTSFGAGGIATIQAAPAGGRAFGREVAVQPDGKIIVAGGAFESGSPAPGKPFVARFTSLGMPDATFGEGGIVETTLGFEHTLFNGGVLAADGRFLASGVTLNLPPTTSDVVVASYLTDTVAPVCSVGAASAVNGRASFSVTSSDSDTGLAKITDAGDGATVDLSSFIPGTRDVVAATVQQTQAGRPGLATITASDRAGNAAACTAGATVLARGKGNRRADAQTFSSVPGTLTMLTVANGPSALRDSTVTIDGTSIDLQLRKTGSTTLDLAPYLHSGSTNTIQLMPEGKPGSSALVTLN